jgi:hypothetical protein
MALLGMFLQLGADASERDWNLTVVMKTLHEDL